MSDDNIYEDEEIFEDKPEAARAGRQDLLTSPTPMPEVHQYAPPVVPPATPAYSSYEEEEEFEEETSEETEEEDYSVTLSDASLRLEQGSLYKIIMNHPLFDGVDADPKAIHNVQKAIRKFAKEQMEIMLGMRQDPETVKVERLEFDFPFNAAEIDFLKQLSYKGTKGESANSDNYVPSAIRTTEHLPVVKSHTLNPIKGASAPKRRSEPQRPLPSRPTTPVKRSPRTNPNIESEVERLFYETGMPKDAIRRALLDKSEPLQKSVSELTAGELEERNRLVVQRRGNQVKSDQAIPMPSPEQAASMVEQRHVPKSNRLIDLALKMPPSKLLNPGE